MSMILKRRITKTKSTRFGLLDILFSHLYSFSPLFSLSKPLLATGWQQFLKFVSCGITIRKFRSILLSLSPVILPVGRYSHVCPSILSCFPYIFYEVVSSFVFDVSTYWNLFSFISFSCSFFHSISIYIYLEHCIFTVL